MGGVRRGLAIAVAVLATPTAAWAAGFDAPTPADPGRQAARPGALAQRLRALGLR